MGNTRFVGLGFAIIAILIALVYEPDDPPEIAEDGWWGRLQKPNGNEDESIRSFKVEIEDSVLADLKERLNRTRFLDPLESVQFQYGFHVNELKKVVKYWMNEFDWRKQESLLNKYDQFLTKIEGIDIHFLRVKPEVKANEKVEILPLLLIHGWPGSVVEFYKILPLLTQKSEKYNFALEVICPSIPGYGFSEAPHQPGFSADDAARIFDKLMIRLGHERYYVQGGDWGSVISKTMATLYPQRVRGLMLNMVPMVRIRGVLPTLKFFVGLIAPSLIYQPEERNMLSPFMEKLQFILQESGYFHLQATKPDTIGAALTDSPAGLAAYILEKFSTWTNQKNAELPGGVLTEKYTMDELLTNVMLYWVTGNSVSSMRFYKESFGKIFASSKLDRMKVQVPTGIAYFPDELFNLPVTIIKHYFENIVRHTYMPRGGHFAALEEPQLLADEILAFIDLVEKSPPQTYIPPTKKSDKRRIVEDPLIDLHTA